MHVPDSLFHGWGNRHAKAMEKTDATVHRIVIPPNNVLMRRWTAFGVKVLINATMTSFDRHIERIKRMLAAYSAY